MRNLVIIKLLYCFENPTGRIFPIKVREVQAYFSSKPPSLLDLLHLIGNVNLLVSNGGLIGYQGAHHFSQLIYFLIQMLKPLFMLLKLLLLGLLLVTGTSVFCHGPASSRYQLIAPQHFPVNEDRNNDVKTRTMEWKWRKYLINPG